MPKIWCDDTEELAQLETKFKKRRERRKLRFIVVTVYQGSNIGPNFVKNAVKARMKAKEIDSNALVGVQSDPDYDVPW